MGNQHASSTSDSDDHTAVKKSRRGKNRGGAGGDTTTDADTAQMSPSAGHGGSSSPDDEDGLGSPDDEDDEIVVTSNDPSAVVERGYLDPAHPPVRSPSGPSGARALSPSQVKSVNKKSRKEKFTRSYKIDRKHVGLFDSQVVHNHGKILTPLDTLYDPALVAEAAAAAAGGDHSMKVAAKSFSDSLRRIQGEDQPLVTLAKTTHFDVPTLRALRGVFSTISCQDAKDDLISAQELCRSTGTNPGSLLGRALFRLMDITRSNQINFRSWVTMLSRLTPAASLDEKVALAFSLYDGDGDGYIDRAELVSMLRSVIHDLSAEDAERMITHTFEQADTDGDQRINLSDYRALVSGSKDFLQSFTIDVPTLLAHYHVISADEVEERRDKLRERDLRQDEKISGAPYIEREKLFMEKEEDDLQVINDVDALDIE
jgi:Ca2+-binding EF-hand superfamily protein